MLGREGGDQGLQLELLQRREECAVFHYLHPRSRIRVEVLHPLPLQQPAPFEHSFHLAKRQATKHSVQSVGKHILNRTNGVQHHKSRTI